MQSRSNSGRFQVKSLSEVNCLVLGQPMIGKTSLLMTIANRVFPSITELPTVYDARVTVLASVGRLNDIYRLNLIDTSGMCKEERRDLYTTVDVLLLCFSFASTQNRSFEMLQTKYFPELIAHCPTKAIVVAGLQVDRLESLSSSAFRHKMRKINHAKNSNAVKLLFSNQLADYIECSAKYSLHVDDIAIACLKAARASVYKRCNPHYSLVQLVDEPSADSTAAGISTMHLSDTTLRSIEIDRKSTTAMAPVAQRRHDRRIAPRKTITSKNANKCDRCSVL